MFLFLVPVPILCFKTAEAIWLKYISLLEWKCNWFCFVIFNLFTVSSFFFSLCWLFRAAFHTFFVRRIKVLLGSAWQGHIPPAPPQDWWLDLAILSTGALAYLWISMHEEAAMLERTHKPNFWNIPFSDCLFNWVLTVKIVTLLLWWLIS